MRYKRDIMKAFIIDRFFEISPDADIIDAYNEYEKEVLETDINTFSKKYDIPSDFTSRILHQYFMDTKNITKENLRRELVACGTKGLVKITTIINALLEFLTNSYNKFTSDEK